MGFWQLLTRPFRQRGPAAATPENPRFNLNDPGAWDALGAQPSTAGVRVNRQTALTYSPYFRALSLISGAVAKLPLAPYRVTDDSRQLDKAHAAYPLVRWKPNARQTAFVWKRTMTLHSLAEGNGYTYVLRDGAARPLELVPLDPLLTFPVSENGKLWYVTQVPGTGEKRKLPREDVLHFAGLSWDGFMGLSLTECAREALGLGMGAQRYGSIVFKNGARPSVVLLHPAKLDSRTRTELREGWERMHAGLDNAHRTAILDQGLQPKELTINAKDAQLLELLAANQIDVANFFDLPPHKLGNRDATSYSSLEQENQACLDECYDPRLCAWEEELRDKLCTEGQKDEDSHVFWFDRRQLVRVNAQTRAAYYRTALGGRPWMTVNQVREEEGMNPLDDPSADQLLDPLNMGRGGQPLPAEEGADPGQGDGALEDPGAPRPRPGALRLGAWDPDQPRDDGGRFAGGEHQGTHERWEREDRERAGRQGQERDALEGRQSHEDRQVERQRDREDRQVERQRDREDRQVERQRDREDEKAHDRIERQAWRPVEERQQREDAQTDRARDKEDAERQARQQRERDEAPPEKRPEVEDRHRQEEQDVADRRRQEDRDTLTRRSNEDSSEVKRQIERETREYDGRQAAARQAEDKATEAHRAAEDAGRQGRRDAEDRARDDRHAREQDELGGRHYDEDEAVSAARERDHPEAWKAWLERD